MLCVVVLPLSNASRLPRPHLWGAAQFVNRLRGENVSLLSRRDDAPNARLPRTVLGYAQLWCRGVNTVANIGEVRRSVLAHTVERARTARSPEAPVRWRHSRDAFIMWAARLRSRASLLAVGGGITGYGAWRLQHSDCESTGLYKVITSVQQNTCTESCKRRPSNLKHLQESCKCG